MGTTVRVVAHLRAKPGGEQELGGVLRGLLAPTRGEAGCISYQLHVDNSDPTHFVFVEEWADDAALDVHMKSPHLGAALGSAGALLAEAPQIYRLTLAD